VVAEFTADERVVVDSCGRDERRVLPANGRPRECHGFLALGCVPLVIVVSPPETALVVRDPRVAFHLSFEVGIIEIQRVDVFAVPLARLDVGVGEQCPLVLPDEIPLGDPVQGRRLAQIAKQTERIAQGLPRSIRVAFDGTSIDGQAIHQPLGGLEAIVRVLQVEAIDCTGSTIVYLARRDDVLVGELLEHLRQEAALDRLPDLCV
jgi:hypothetical protein